jgi:hypothetical protein
VKKTNLLEVSDKLQMGKDKSSSNSSGWLFGMVVPLNQRWPPS